jgi:hypothetical protein
MEDSNKPPNVITLEKEYAWQLREAEKKDPFQQEEIKKIQCEILWLEQQLLREHPLLNKQFPPQYREDFDELQRQTAPIREELTRLRRKNTLEKKDREEAKQMETLRLQSLFEQRITTQQHPLLHEDRREDPIAHLRHVKGTHDHVKLKDFDQQQDSVFKRLQEGFSRPEDMLVPENISPEELRGPPIELAILDASFISDGFYEKLTGESLTHKKLSKTDKLQKKIEALPLLRQVFSSAILLRHFKRRRGEDGKFHGYIYHPYRMLIVGEGKEGKLPCTGSVIIISSHEYEDRENLKPKTQMFSSLYKAHRSLKHSLQSLDKNRKEINTQKTILEQLFLDFDSYDVKDREQKEQLLLRLYASIEALEGKTSAEAFFAKMNLRKATGLKDRLGRVNPSMCKAYIGGAMQRVGTRLGEIVEEMKYIQSHEKIMDNEISTQELQLQSMIFEIEKFGERRFFQPNDIRLKIMIRNFKNILCPPEAPQDSPVGKAEPFKTYYDILRQKVLAIEQFQQNPTRENMRELNKTMVKIYTILKFFSFQQQTEHLLDTLQFDKISREHTGDLLQTLRDIFGKHFARKNFKVQQETRVPSYDKPFLEVKKQFEKVGILLRDVHTSSHPQKREELLHVLKSLNIKSILLSLH